MGGGTGGGGSRVRRNPAASMERRSNLLGALIGESFYRHQVTRGGARGAGR